MTKLPSGYNLPSPEQLFKGLTPRVQDPDTQKPATRQDVVRTPAASAPRPSAAAAPQPAASLSLQSAAGQGSSLANLNLVSNYLNQKPTVAPPASPQAAPSRARLPLPARQANAPTGSQFMEQIRHLSGAAREQAMLDQILAGNVPDHLRHFKEIQLSAKGGDGQRHTATVRTLPDYLAIGSNGDYALVPMTPLTAQKIADATGSSLPTRKLVDDIYSAAEVKLTPSPKQPGAIMMTTGYFNEHNETVRQQRAAAGAQNGQLIAGHKKDVVISNLLDQKPHRVAIYGWHQPNGKAIQPLSTIHEDTYADYSHGIRLIAGTVKVDGVERPIAEVLNDKNLAPLLSDEGPIHSPKVKL